STSARNGTGGTTQSEDADVHPRRFLDAGPDRDDGQHSGSRIKVRGYEVDSVQVASGVLWDDMRGVDCAPTLSSDGTERCMPRGETALYFGDPGCKQPIMPGYSGAPDACGKSTPLQTYALG